MSPSSRSSRSSVCSSSPLELIVRPVEHVVGRVVGASSPYPAFAYSFIARVRILRLESEYQSHFLSSISCYFPPFPSTSIMATSGAAQSLHPPRLAPIFAGTPSAPGTPVHSIQTMRRKSAGHSGPLTKILVANRGVRVSSLLEVYLSSSDPLDASFYVDTRKSLFVSSVPPTSSRCTPSRSTRSRIVSLLTVKRYPAASSFPPERTVHL